MKRLVPVLACAAALAAATPASAQRPGVGVPSAPPVDPAALQAASPRFLCDGRLRVTVSGVHRHPTVTYVAEITNTGPGQTMMRVFVNLPPGAAGNGGSGSTVWRTMQSGETRQREAVLSLNLEGGGSAVPSSTVAQHLNATCR